MSCKDAGGRCGGGIIVITAHTAGGSASWYITCGAITLCQCWVTWESTGNIYIMAEKNPVLTGIVTGSRWNDKFVTFLLLLLLSVGWLCPKQRWHLLWIFFQCLWNVNCVFPLKGLALKCKELECIIHNPHIYNICIDALSGSLL